MSRGAQLRVSSTRTIPKPNYYVQALYDEFGQFCYDEAAAPDHRGSWRSEFGVELQTPLDLEIGPGNGNHFAHRAFANQQRALLGIELKYKPLIQSIRRACNLGLRNARMMRFNASLLEQIFVPEEINDVFIHFPDPWEKLRQQKHRLLQREFLLKLWQAQRPGSLVEVKMDNRSYFDWFLVNLDQTPYRVIERTFDLHLNPPGASTFTTQFERIFMAQGLPICRALLQK